MSRQDDNQNNKFVRIACIVVAAVALTLFVVQITLSCNYDANNEPTGNTVNAVSNESNVSSADNRESAMVFAPEKNTSIEPVVPDEVEETGPVKNASELLSGKKMTEVSLDTVYSPDFPISEQSLVNLKDAILQIEENGPCSMVLYELDGDDVIVYKPDERVYVASASKMFMVFYIVSGVSGEEFAAPGEDGTGIGTWTSRDIEDVILYSDNDGYDELCYSYYTSDFVDWVRDNYGVEHDIYNENGAYFDASAASLAALWVDVDKYIEEGSPNAKWLASLLAQTEMSFIRDGIEVSGTVATVMNKAGWISEDGYDDEFGYTYYGINSTSDCGIVEIDGSKYIVSIMTGQPYSIDAALNVGAAARAWLGLPAMTPEEKARLASRLEEEYELDDGTLEFVVLADVLVDELGNEIGRADAQEDGAAETEAEARTV